MNPEPAPPPASAVLPPPGAPLPAATLTELAMSVFSGAGIVIADQRGTILAVNEAFLAASGSSLSDVLGRTLHLLDEGSPGREVNATFLQEARERGIWRGEVARRHRDGRVVAELLTVSAVCAEGRVSHFVGVLCDITALKDHQRELECLGQLDALTGLPNRALLMDRLQQMLAGATRHGRQVAVCYLDLDGFKAINDVYGHRVGDRVLVDVAQRLTREVRSGDTVARLGGDEFVLLLANPGSPCEVGAVLERVLAAVAQPLAGRPSIVVTASLGVTLFPGDLSDPATLLEHADAAMYGAKRAGRATYRVFEGAVQTRLQVGQPSFADIGAGLADDRFCLDFEPMVGLAERRVVGYEALLRWRKPTGARLSPEHLPADPEHPRLGARIDLFTLRLVLQQMASWRTTGFRTFVSLKISAGLLADAEFPERIASLLDEFPGVDPADLELEVTEDAVIDDLSRVTHRIVACAGRGIAFAIARFGSGKSSLVGLARLPARTLKIDPALVAVLTASPEARAVLCGILALARASGRRVVAEGVETPSHIRRLAHLGCHVVQGPGISEPLPSAQVPGWAETLVFNEHWLPGPADRPCDGAEDDAAGRVRSSEKARHRCRASS